MDYLSDTTFLIDLWRDRVKGGPASRFADAHAGQVVAVPWIAKAEFLRGAFVVAQGAPAELFLKTFQTLWPGEVTVREYAELYGKLRLTNTMIGPHDLWIAASALELGLPLLTRNTAEFKRVPGLTVKDYREE